MRQLKKGTGARRMPVRVIVAVIGGIIFVAAGVAVAANIASNRQVDFFASGTHQFYVWCAGGKDYVASAEGVNAEDVSQVFITHLHFDHVGWAARQSDGGMTPTFPNASYRWTSAEQEAWRDTPASGFVRQDIFAAVAPRWQAADGGVQIAEGIDVVPLPGHTPGHAGVVA